MFDQQAIRQSDPKMQLVSIPPALLSTQQTGNRLRPRQLTTQGQNCSLALCGRAEHPDTPPEALAQ